MREPTTTVLVTALLGCAAATAGACGQRIGGERRGLPARCARSLRVRAPPKSVLGFARARMGGDTRGRRSERQHDDAGSPSQVPGGEPCRLADLCEHFRANFHIVVPSEHMIRPALTRESTV